MSNPSVNETLQFSTNSENVSITYWENVFSYSLANLTASSQHLGFKQAQLIAESAFVCWFIGRKEFFASEVELLLLAISFLSVYRKDLNICGLSFVWTCYVYTINLIRGFVLTSCLILFIVTLKLSAIAPDYLSHLEFTVDILFVYYVISELFSRYIRVSSFNTRLFIAILFYARCCLDIPVSPGSNVSELNLILMMLFDMIALALLSDNRAITADWQIVYQFTYITLAFGYCFYKNITLHGVTG